MLQAAASIRINMHLGMPCEVLFLLMLLLGGWILSTCGSGAFAMLGVAQSQALAALVHGV